MIREPNSAIPANPHIRRVEIDRPWVWLAAGWRDFLAVPGISLAYGAAFSIAGFLLTWGLHAADKLPLILPLAAGFMLIGPIAAVGLYDVSRRLERGETVTLASAMRAMPAHVRRISAMALLLMLVLLAWFRIALLIFAIFFGDSSVRLEDFIGTVFFAPTSLPFVITGTAVGAVLATIVFTISVIALPMLLDRDIGVPAAIASSFAVVDRNRSAMMLWAALIVIFTAAGLATLYVGLAVCLPLIGHASWHAYRDLVDGED